MNKYTMTTATTMKEYNRDKFWVDVNFVRPVKVWADNPSEALAKYATEVYNRDYVAISKTALKKKSPMYIDTKHGTIQTGYVVTAKMDFETSDYKWQPQYVELWVEITQNVTEW